MAESMVIFEACGRICCGHDGSSGPAHGPRRRLWWRQGRPSEVRGVRECRCLRRQSPAQLGATMVGRSGMGKAHGCVLPRVASTARGQGCVTRGRCRRASYGVPGGRCKSHKTVVNGTPRGPADASTCSAGGGHRRPVSHRACRARHYWLNTARHYKSIPRCRHLVIPRASSHRRRSVGASTHAYYHNAAQARVRRRAKQVCRSSHKEQEHDRSLTMADPKANPLMFSGAHGHAKQSTRPCRAAAPVVARGRPGGQGQAEAEKEPEAHFHDGHACRRRTTRAGTRTTRRATRSTLTSLTATRSTLTGPQPRRSMTMRARS